MGDWNHPWPVPTAVAYPEICGRLLAYADDVGLSDEQQAAIRNLVKAWRQRYGSSLSKISEVVGVLKEEMERRPPDLSSTFRVIDEHTRLLNSLEKAQAEAVAQVLEVLTSEQARKIREIYLTEKSIHPPRIAGLL